MLFNSKISAPKPGFAELKLPVFNRVLDNAISLFAAPEGYLLTDSLASVFIEHGITSCWVRLGLEDCDPGTLLLSLINGTRKYSPTIGETTLAMMRKQPGPIAGWEPLYIHLAAELNHLLPRGTVLVLEGIDCLNYSPLCLGLLGEKFLAHIELDLHTVIITTQNLPWAVLPADTVVYDTRDLRLDEQSGMRMLSRMDCGLSGEVINRTIFLSEGRATALAGLMNALVLLGSSLVDSEVRRAGNLQELLVRVARATLKGADENTQQALALALQVEYSHPAITRFSQPVSPWQQPLEDGWNRLRKLWTQPLRKVLKVKALAKSLVVEQAVNFLLNDHAFYQVVNLYFDLGKPAHAARVIEKIADEMMDLGQWATLNAWHKRLPANVLPKYPWLIYIGGKISAEQGNIDTAQKAFARSSEIFLHQENKRRACLSMLAESASATWRGELVFAKERALSAFFLAQRADLKLYETWSAWRLGGLATQAGDLDEALAWFTPAAEIADKAEYVPLGELLHLAIDLIRRLRELEQVKIYQRQSFFECEKAEAEVQARLRSLIEQPPEKLDELLKEHGWTNMPLMPGLPMSIQPMPDERENIILNGLLRDFIHIFGWQNSGRWNILDGIWMKLDENGKADPITANSRPEGTELLPDDWLVSESDQGMKSLDAIPVTSAAADLNMDSRSRAAELLPIRTNSTKPRVGLKVILLGRFSVTLEEHAINDWTHNKSRTIFKYLIAHRNQLTSREVLMETFWPDAAPDSARNSLNVALHNLRQILHTSDNHLIIQFRDNGYLILPDVDVWVDIEEFDKKVQEGRKMEAGGLNNVALQEYEKAIALYQGDFMEDDPYEEWPVMLREHLRVGYMDTLDRSSQMYFNLSDYDACIARCLMIIANDSCREDAHCRLMRCYSRLGQVHLALRQYQECVDALKVELEVNPAATTTALYNKIRQREEV